MAASIKLNVSKQNYLNRIAALEEDMSMLRSIDISSSRAAIRLR